MPEEPRIKFSESVNSMTIRDYFAGQVVSQLIHINESYGTACTRDDLALDAYEIADSMLKAREV